MNARASPYLFTLRVNRHRGMTLVELMVSITIGLLITLSMLTLYINLSQSNAEMIRSNRLIENGRFAIQLLQSDLVHAGFWGDHLPMFEDRSSTTAPDAPSALADPCLTYSTSNWNSDYIENLIGIPVQGYAAAIATCPASLFANLKTGTDVLVVRYLEPCSPGDTNCDADAVGKLYFQSSRCTNEIATRKAAANPGYIFAPTADPTAHTLRSNMDCDPNPAVTPAVNVPARKRKFISNIYFIRNYAYSQGDGIPTLVRSSFDLNGSTLAHQPAVSLVDGIESFVVEYGLDNIGSNGAAVSYSGSINRGDGIPDAYVRCTTAVPCTFSQMTNVVAVKLYVLVRNLETTTGYSDGKTYKLGGVTLGPFNDAYKRHVFASTVRLVNPAGRREH